MISLPSSFPLLDPASTLWAGATGPLFHYFRGCSPAERERGVRRSRWRHSRSRAMAKLAPATPLQAPSHHARTSLALRTPSPRHFSATHTIAGSRPKLCSRRLGATDPPNDDMQHPQLLHDPLITLHTLAGSLKGRSTQLHGCVHGRGPGTWCRMCSGHPGSGTDRQEASTPPTCATELHKPTSDDLEPWEGMAHRRLSPFCAAVG